MTKTYTSPILYQKFVGIIVLILAFQIGNAQLNYPQNYFIAPLDLPLILAGSFAEPRSNHFHSGLDLKTNSETGKKVFAVADGYVSRINVSPSGYGNAIYIQHPNGYTSVYAHVETFSESVNQLVKYTQYMRKSFSVNIYPKVGSIPVKQGEIIARSGNSGSSEGPHLHFEIRDSRTEEPINPLLFGYQIADTQFPIIEKLRLYSLNGDLPSNFQEYNLSKKTKNCQIKEDTITLKNNRLYAAIKAYDLWDNANNQNGIYEIKYYFDDQLYFHFKADRINFANQRTINAYLDYESYILDNIRFQKAFIEKNVSIRNVKKVMNRGILQIHDSLVHRLRIEATDYAGQTSMLEVKLRKSKQTVEKKPLVVPNMDCKKRNSYHEEHLQLEIPLGAFYSDQNFWAKTYPQTDQYFSPIFELYKPSVPLHLYCTLRIVPDTSLDSKLYSKAGIVRLKKNTLEWEGGKFHGNYLETKIREFGIYTIQIDSLAPSLIPIEITDNQNVSNLKQISFEINDNLSGIKSYQAILDGRWLLFAYDLKSHRITYQMDENFPMGEHNLEVEITDQVGNSTKRSFQLKRD